MTSKLAFLSSGIVLGLTSGLSPGPMLTLVISETLRHGSKEGIKISFVPFLTDLPIILIAVFILSRLSDITSIMGAISFMGGGFLVYLGFESLRVKRVDMNDTQMKLRSIQKGIVVNFLNPSPYLFWFTIGSPIVLRAFHLNPFYTFFFVFSFYACLVGSKVLVALLVGKSRFFLKSNNYIYTIRGLGIILFLLAGLFFKEGLTFFGIFVK